MADLPISFWDGILGWCFFLSPMGDFSTPNAACSRTLLDGMATGGQADHSKDDGTTLAAIRKMITESDDPDGDG